MTTKLVELISLGGTISMVEGNTGAVPGLDASDFLRGSKDGVRPHSFSRIASSNFTRSMLLDLSKHISASDAEAFVITQGTDTLEESSFFFSLVHEDARPVVFTGAMRTASHTSPDGPSNIEDALTAVRAMKTGTAVMMAGALHDPLFVRKVHTSHLDAFESDTGPVADIREGELIWRKPLAERLKFHVGTNIKWPRIALVTAHMDDDMGLSWLESADAFVVAGFGGGHVGEVWRDQLVEIAKLKPVVFASRCSRGAVMTKTYGYKGAELDLMQQGLISAGVLSSTKARLLLGIILVANVSNWRQHFDAFAQSN